MRKLTLLLTILFFASCTSQKKLTTLTQKVATSKGKEIVLEEVLSDSRCPEKTQCIWAGEVVFKVAVYENGTLVEKKKFTLSPNKEGFDLDWFQKHLADTTTKLKEIQVLPYPKNGITTKKEEYYIKLVY